MPLKLFEGLKKERTVTRTRHFYKNLIIGSDYIAFKLFERLALNEGVENVKILNQEKLSEENLFFKGPWGIRGEANKKALKRFYPELDLEKSPSESVFYKDQKFRKFGGRSKPMELSLEEKKFTEKRTDFTSSQILSDEFQEKWGEFGTSYLQHNIDSVEKLNPSDLIEQTHWRVNCSDGNFFECENLYWGDGPFSFFSVFNDKASLSDDFVNFCESTQTKYSLCITLTFNREISNQEETLFIPQSQTYEKGHYITEFKKFDEELGQQKARFFTYIEEGQSTPEEIAKIIRNLKSTLKRIYPEFVKAKFEEDIKVTNKNPALFIKDLAFNNCENELSHFDFFGMNAPILPSYLEENNIELNMQETHSLGRSLLSLAQIERKLH